MQRIDCYLSLHWSLDWVNARMRSDVTAFHRNSRDVCLHKSVINDNEMIRSTAALAAGLNRLANNLADCHSSNDAGLFANQFGPLSFISV